MNNFSLPRFGRLMQNDLLRIMRPVLYCSAALLGVTVGIYLAGFRNARPAADPVHEILFGWGFVITGLVFTSGAFKDMHHPLEGTHFLMLPVSNLERLLSRYLLTGPLFALYATLAYTVFDLAGNQLTQIWINKHQIPFSPTAAATIAVIKGYLIAHVATFIGAICFRVAALPGTILFLLLVLLTGILVEHVAERIFFPELFSWTLSWAQLAKVRPLPFSIEPWFAVSWMNVVFVVGAFAWMLYVAYLCLRDHEARDHGATDGV